MSAPNFSRRLFLGGMASLAVASTVKTATFVPTLYGDMVHDDAPALNALFRGEPIRVLSGRVIQGARPAVVDAKLLLGSPLVITSGDFVLANSELTAAKGFDGDCVIRLDNWSGGVITRCTVIGVPEWGPTIRDGRMRVRA